MSIKRSVAVRLEQELLQAQQAARRGSKRKVEGKPRLVSPSCWSSESGDQSVLAC